MATYTATAGGGNWNSPATWGEMLFWPGAADTVILNAASGGVTVNVASACAVLNMSNYAATLTMSQTLTVGTISSPGNITLGGTIAGVGLLECHTITSFTSNGVTVPTLSFIDGTVTLGDDLEVSGNFNTYGAMIINGFSITSTGATVFNVYSSEYGAGVSGTTELVIEGSISAELAGGRYVTVENPVQLNTSGSVVIAADDGSNISYVGGTPSSAFLYLYSIITPTFTLDTDGMTWDIISQDGGGAEMVLGSDLTVDVFESYSDMVISGDFDMTVNTSLVSYGNIEFDTSVSTTLTASGVLSLYDGLYGASGITDVVFNGQATLVGGSYSYVDFTAYPQKCWMSNQGLGVSGLEFWNSSAVVPTNTDVRTGVTYGPTGVEYSGQCAVPAATNVRLGVNVDATVGNLELPVITDVRATIAYGANSTEYTGNLMPPLETDVRNGVGYGANDGAEYTGNVVLPAITNVRATIAYGAWSTEYTGNLMPPVETDVRNGIGYGAGDGAEYTGNVVLPATTDVKDTVQYGANGTEYTGSYTGSCDYPAETNVRSGITYASGAMSGNVVLPATSNVKQTVQYGANGTEFTGLYTAVCDYPVGTNVRYGTTYAYGTMSGYLVLPAEDNVRFTIGYGSYSTEFTGNMTLPSASDVKIGVTYGSNGVQFAGTYDLVTPAALQAEVDLLRTQLLELQNDISIREKKSDVHTLNVVLSSSFNTISLKLTDLEECVRELQSDLIDARQLLITHTH